VADPLQQLIDRTSDIVRPLEKDLNLAEWEAASTGTEDANQKQQAAHAAYLRFWADPGRYAEAKRLRERSQAADPQHQRQLQLIYLQAAKSQQDTQSIDALTRLEAEVRTEYYNFRGSVDGRQLSDNELVAILKASTHSDEVKAAWESSKQVGARVADRVRQLARLRNASARRQGYRDHFERSLTLDEIDENRLLALFSQLEAETRNPFAALKAEIDRKRAARFGVPPSKLMPWHYPDRFFQEAPPMGGVDMDALFAGKDLTALATRTYDGLGLEVRDILARSDLYARPGKNQHAFSIHIDRDGDVRTLNNLEPDLHWNNTLHHELGHGVYDKYLDPGLPWLLRMPSHTLTTEAIAILMGGVTGTAPWLNTVLGLQGREAERVAAASRQRGRAASLIFTRWCLVMTLFEKALYADPEGDLDGLWWHLVERYQMLRKPPGRQAPDWAAKYHVALAPVYYHNYELGILVSDQILYRLEREIGGVVDHKAAGEWLRKRIFAPGASQDWEAHVRSATGEPLNPTYFARAVA
jgi:peptidyl-dipeptidase A